MYGRGGKRMGQEGRRGEARVGSWRVGKGSQRKCW